MLLAPGRAARALAGLLLFRSRMRAARLGLLLLALLPGCAAGGTKIVPLLAAAGIPATEPTTVPLEVVTRSTAVRDPMPLQGTGIVYGDVEAALGFAVSSAATSWADAHRKHRTGKVGWQLFVEITNAEADYEQGRVVFSVGVRATLRARAGNVYLAQTAASCRQGGIVAPDQGAPIIYRCMTEVGHDLAGWLDGINLDTVNVPD
jgi:hypothetical protein